METLLTWLIAGSVLGFFLIRYWRAHKRKESAARERAEQGPLFSEGPKAQHPRIDTDACIGCGACVSVCPEGDVLALIDGKATIINGHKCIGHGLCAEECPVGAITMVMAKPSAGADLPVISECHETSVENLFIVGELGGLALIKNAVNQGRDCIDVIAPAYWYSQFQRHVLSLLRRDYRGRGSGGHQRIAASGGASAQGSHPGARNCRRHGFEVSSPEAGDDQSGRISACMDDSTRPLSPKRTCWRSGRRSWRETDLNIHTGEGVDAVGRGPRRTFSGAHSARRIPVARGCAGAWARRHAAQTRRQGRRAIACALSPHRSRSLHGQEYSRGRRRRQRGRGGHGPGASGGQQGHAVLPSQANSAA